MQNTSNVNLSFSYVDDDFDLTSNKKKIIRLSSKGFCIAVIPLDNKPKQLFQYAFTSNNLALEDKLDVIANVNREIVQCENNLFSIYTQFNVQIPDEFYNQEDDKAILPLLVENPQKYIPFAEHIDAWKLYNVSALENELSAGLTKKFPNYKLSTVLSSLLKIVAEEKEDKNVLIFVEDNNFTIIAVNGRKLLGVNTFVFSNEADFLYYTHSFLRKMYINPENVSLKLCGNIAPQSPLHSILNKYYSSVGMLACAEDTSGNYSYFCDLFL